MMLMEYNEAETMNLFREEGREEGCEEGREEGEDILARLINQLFAKGLVDEAQKVAEDKSYRKEMYVKLGLMPAKDV